MAKRKKPRDLGRYQQVGSLLAEMRELAGLSQQDVAQAIGRPQSFVSIVEAGQHRVDVIELIDLANALGFEPADLIERLRRVKKRK